MHTYIYTHTYTYEGWGKSRFTVVHIESNTINNHTRINCVLCTHNCKPTFATPCGYVFRYVLHSH